MRILAVFAAAYAAAVFASTQILPGGALLPLGGFCVLAAGAVFRFFPKGRKRQRRYALLCCAGLAAGLLWTWGYGQLFLSGAQALDDRTVVLSGTVMEWPRADGSVIIRADLEGPGSVTTLLYTGEEEPDLRPGDRVQTIAHCHVTQGTEGATDSYQASRGVFLEATAYGAMEVRRPERISLTAVPAYLSRALIRSIQQAFPEDVSGLITALVTGDKDGLDDTFQAALQRTGLSHVVAVSGMHLAFLAGLLVLLLGRGRRRTALISLPVIALFVLVTGCAPSVVRAAVMAALLQLAPLFGRERDDATALAFALFLLLVQNPYAAGNAGLQLSFAAVVGILLFSGRLQERMLAKFLVKNGEGKLPAALWNGAARFVCSTLAATFGALVFTTPLTAFYFDTIALIAPLANLLALWAVSAAFGGGLIAGAAGVLWPAAGAAAALVVTPFARCFNAVVLLLAKVPFASIPLTTVFYRLWLLFVYALGALALVTPGKKGWRLPLCACAVTLAAAVVFTGLSFRAGAVTVQVLDVGQGQSVLLRTGNFLTLVDCGGDGSNNAGDVAADQIQALGFTGLDLLVVSHYHTDHANGIAQLLERVEVERLVLPDVEPESELRRSILAQAERYDIPVTYITRDTTLTIGEETKYTFYPPLGEEDSNELGLTVLCSAGDFDVLITGDMGSQVEAVLVDHASLPDVEVMVAGHHGSKYANSQLLLETVRPDIAVFSVGAYNEYGHPTQEAMDRFASVGARLYRTDQIGTVTIHIEDTQNQE